MSAPISPPPARQAGPGSSSTVSSIIPTAPRRNPVSTHRRGAQFSGRTAGTPKRSEYPPRPTEPLKTGKVPATLKRQDGAAPGWGVEPNRRRAAHSGRATPGTPARGVSPSAVILGPLGNQLPGKCRDGALELAEIEAVRFELAAHAAFLVEMLEHQPRKARREPGQRLAPDLVHLLKLAAARAMRCGDERFLMAQAGVAEAQHPASPCGAACRSAPVVDR